MSILESKQKNQVTIESEDNLKIKLKSAAIRRINTERDNILTQDEKRAIKSLRNNRDSDPAPRQGGWCSNFR